MTNQATALLETVVVLNKKNLERYQPTEIAADKVSINPRGKKSVEYARVRAAINEDVNRLYKDNAAGAKNFKNARKKVLIEFLAGTIEWKDNKKFVMFPDASQARY